MVLSYNERTEVMEKRHVNQLYRQQVDEELVRITLDDGSEVCITKAHRLFNGTEWTNDFSEGDVICVPANTQTFPNQGFQSSVELGRLMGWHISVGYEHSREHIVTISQKDNVLEMIKSDFKNVVLLRTYRHNFSEGQRS